MSHLNTLNSLLPIFKLYENKLTYPLVLLHCERKLRKNDSHDLHLVFAGERHIRHIAIIIRGEFTILIELK